MFAGVGGIGTTTREGGDCGGVGGCDVAVDAEKEDGGAYGGDSDDVCDWMRGEGGEDRFDPSRVESLFLSLFVGLSSLGRRTLPLAVDGMAVGDLNADGAADPEVDDNGLCEESVAEPP